MLLWHIRAGSQDSVGHVSKSPTCFRSSTRASSYTRGPTWGTSGTWWTSPWCPVPSPHSITPWRKLIFCLLVKKLWLTMSHPIIHKKNRSFFKNRNFVLKASLDTWQRKRQINAESLHLTDWYRAPSLWSSLEDRGQHSAQLGPRYGHIWVARR